MISNPLSTNKPGTGHCMNLSKTHACLNKTTSFLIGSPFKPPLNRRGFIRAALFVFLVRYPITSVLGIILLELGPQRGHDIWAPLYGLFVMIPVLCIFFAQYCFVFYRRLKGIGFRLPGILTCSLVIITFIILMFTPEKYFTKTTFLSELVEIACFLIPYLLLLPWKDKPKIVVD